MKVCGTKCKTQVSRDLKSFSFVYLIEQATALCLPLFHNITNATNTNFPINKQLLKIMPNVHFATTKMAHSNIHSFLVSHPSSSSSSSSTLFLAGLHHFHRCTTVYILVKLHNYCHSVCCVYVLMY